MQKLLIITFTIVCTCFYSPLLAYPTDLPDCLKDDYDQLESLYKYTAGDNWTNKDGWLSEPDMSKWYGITLTADGCGVEQINLSGNKLSQNLPHSFTLSTLTYFDLSNNELGGDIPNWDLPLLTHLDLSNNQLVKDIPEFVFPNLIHLDLHSNQLTGRLSESRTSRELRYLDLSANRLEGEIPDYTLSQLTFLALNDNFFVGTIKEFRGINELTHLNLSNNQLSGKIPESPNYGSIVYFDIHGNNLEGEVPRLTMPNIETFNISSNKLSATMPDFDFSNLQVFDVSNNQLSGRIPTLNSANLTNINLSYNSFEGSIPHYSLRNLLILNLSSNKLTGEIPAMELPELSELNLSSNGLEGELTNINFPKLANVYVNNNALKGKVPEFESTNLTELKINNNFFSSSIPTFERNHLSLFHFNNNRFVFGDMVGKPWLSMVSPKLQYSEQANIPMNFAGQYLSVQTGAADGDQVFNWYRNGVFIVSTNTHLLQPTISGVYTCRILHNNITVLSDAPRNLVLQTEPYSYTAAVLNTELISLKASPIGHSIQVAWQTAEEKNSHYFDIERSVDGKNFEKLGTQKAQGSSSSKTNYTFMDEKAVNGIQYYRLKMVDIDQTVRYSPIVAATIVDKDKKHPLSISPNPASDLVRFQIDLDASTPMSLDIRDLMGRSVYRTQILNGQNIVWESVQAIRGIYFATFTSGNQQFTEKIVLK